ncbi:hypothetical protein AMC78_CH03158 [Rhizobium phaseoli]|uniref:hypothetical protein n=1 Tax=Rhizobium phaseoli TaxID=396 RepID=UPI0007E9DE40|nr:hypothetical protein [Rhizobium phaseoli]ANM05227.1 hypothetical protein AMC78_CH03158 [Rhizobium phaseoli]
MSDAISKPSSLTIDLDEDAADNQLENVVDLGSVVSLDDPRDPDIIDEDAGSADRLPEGAVQNENGSVTLPLSFPVTLRIRKGGEVRERVYRDLTFHRLNGADMRAISAAGSEHQSAVTFARSTRINQATMNALFDNMDLSDIDRAGGILVFFVSNGRKTGG